MRKTVVRTEFGLRVDTNAFVSKTVLVQTFEPVVHIKNLPNSQILKLLEKHKLDEGYYNKTL